MEGERRRDNTRSGRGRKWNSEGSRERKMKGGRGEKWEKEEQQQ